MNQVSEKKLPRKISGFILRRDHGRPDQAARARATLEYNDGSTMPLGVLRPDARGYVSFRVPEASDAEIAHIWLEVSGAKKVDALRYPVSRDGVADFLVETDRGNGEAMNLRAGSTTKSNSQSPSRFRASTHWGRLEIGTRLGILLPRTPSFLERYRRPFRRMARRCG